MYRQVLWLAAAAGLLVAGSAAFAQDADTVDGFHAYGTPHANALLALDGSARLPGSVIASNSIPGSRLVPGAVTAGRLGNNSVTTEKISDGQVMSADLAAGAVTRTKIANGAVTNTKIADRAVTGGKLAYGAVTAGRLGNNSVSTSKIIDGAIRGEDVHIPLLMGGNRDGYLIGCFNGSASDSATGICGYSTSTTAQYSRGVVGACNSKYGYGVYGVNKATQGSAYGVYGRSEAAVGHGVFGRGYCGVFGDSSSASGTAVCGFSHGTDGTGVCGFATANSGTTYGVYGEVISPNGYAGYFDGDVHVHGTITKTQCLFKVDHPLDPENMYLYHCCVESSERMNVYSGNAVLDARGEAWVELPDWFEGVNCDFRYQLTPIGAPGPNLYIAQKIQDGWFSIAGGLPGTEVSWVVMASRNDPYAAAHPFEVEVDKPERERGYYIHPELYGMPETMGVSWATKPEAMRERYPQR